MAFLNADEAEADATIWGMILKIYNLLLIVTSAFTNL